MENNTHVGIVGISQAAVRSPVISAFALTFDLLCIRMKVFSLALNCQKIGKGEYLLCKVSLEVTSNVLSVNIHISLSCLTPHRSFNIGVSSAFESALTVPVYQFCASTLKQKFVVSHF